MKKIISFSLWGDNPKYTAGAIENARLIKEVYGKEWLGRYYCGTSVPHSFIAQLRSFRWVEVIVMNVPGDWRGAFWRFLPASDPDVDIVLSRDVDSRLGQREKAAVDEWLQSDKAFHIMRDHPYHCVPILGGMWGTRKQVLPNMKSNIEQYQAGNYWQSDQEFLRDVVYPKIKSDSFIHDSFFRYETHAFPFPTKREAGLFVGQVYDASNIPDQGSSDFLQKIEALREE